MRKKRLALLVGQAFGLGALAAASQAFAQQAADPVQRVEITGSAIRQIAKETALPVTIISSEDLAKQGVSSVEQAAQLITANQGVVGTAQGIGATTGGRASIDLRGLGVQNGNSGARTLVLLDGRRIANHAYSAASADLNAVPMAAIDRIEVLRDGASALYGSDAIGGVVNFVLKRDFQGVEISGYKDILKQDSGDSQGFSVAVGAGSLQQDGFNFLGTFSYRHQEVIPALDREYGRTGIRPDLGFAGSSGTPFPANFTQGALAGNPSRAAGGTCPPLAFNNPNPAVLNCRYDFSGLIDLLPVQEQTQGMFRGSFKFGEHVAALSYVRAENQVTNRVAPTPITGLGMPNTSPFFPGGAGGTPAFPGLDPTTGITLAWRSTAAGQRTDAVDSTADRAVLSLDGVVVGWDYSVGLWTSTSEVHSAFTNGYVDRPQIVAAMNAGLLNPFGPQTPAGQAAINAAKIIGNVIDAKGKVDGIDGKISKDIAMLPAGPLAMALGFEARHEDFLFGLTKDATGASFASRATSSGLEGTVDSGGKRDMYGVFAEFNIPLIAKKLDATLSVRYDHYDLTGDTTNPKAGIRWQPVESFLMRGSVNTGFRAPSLLEIFNPQQTTFTTNPYDDPFLCAGGVPTNGGQAGRDCQQQFNSLFGGPVGIGLAPESLKAEKSKNWTIGAVWEPTRNFSVGLDYWDVRLKDTIGQLPEQAIFGDPVKYANRFVRCGAVTPAILANPQISATCFDPITGALQPGVLAYIFDPTENLGEVRTSGIDVTAKWRVPMGEWGNLSFGINGTYVDKYKYQREKNGDYISAAGKYSDAGPILRWVHVATADWQYGPWITTLANRYKSGYTDENNVDRVDPANLGHKVDAYSVWDLFVAYKGIKNLTLRAGVKNMFNEDPPASNQGATFQQGYDPRIADIFGRVYTIQGSYKF